MPFLMVSGKKIHLHKSDNDNIMVSADGKIRTMETVLNGVFRMVSSGTKYDFGYPKGNFSPFVQNDERFRRCG